MKITDNQSKNTELDTNFIAVIAYCAANLDFYVKKAYGVRLNYVVRKPPTLKN